MTARDASLTETVSPRVPVRGEMMTAYQYHGRSMHGTFREGELLLVDAAPLRAIRPGDVIAFSRVNAAGETVVVAHRVRGRRGDGLLTQGDALATLDTEPVRAEALIGRVRFGQRGDRLYRVRGGMPGRLWPACLRLARRARAALRAPYGWLRASGVLRRWLHLNLTQVRLTTERGPLVKYLHGGRTVAWWWPDQRRFACCKPYDLVLAPPADKTSEVWSPGSGKQS